MLLYRLIIVVQGTQNACGPDRTCGVADCHCLSRCFLRPLTLADFPGEELRERDLSTNGFNWMGKS